MRRILATLTALATALVLAALLAVLLAAGSPADAAGSAATARHVIRPVTDAGEPASGYRVTTRKGRVSCFGRSAAAVDDGITTCGPSAAYLPSCWRSTHHTVLCLRSPRSRTLVRVRFQGHWKGVQAPRHPRPQALVLGDGERCLIRIGGAWGQVPAHPTWVGFYSCGQGEVYGPPTGDGLHRARASWRVHLWQADGDLVRRTVRAAYYVGTAA
ncbi:MAG: hypothetical protein QM638_10660 [Nocardioides sp.]|uniref:hypothetical protein n=1 Tax=Nocardioides sp. TaxID=35761 RepID=UPI0039E6519B